MVFLGLAGVGDAEDVAGRVSGVQAQAKVGHEVQAAAGPAALCLAHHHHAQGWQLCNEVQALRKL